MASSLCESFVVKVRNLKSSLIIAKVHIQTEKRLRSWVIDFVTLSLGMQLLAKQRPALNDHRILSFLRFIRALAKTKEESDQ